MAADHKKLFLQALTLPAAQRWAFVVDACGDNLSLRRDVAELLSYHGQSGDLFDTLGVDELARRFPLDLPERLGHYAIEDVLGVGAMGVVYRARRSPGALADSGAPGGQADPGVPVALKVLRMAAVTGDGRSRFRREAEVLRKLEHPGIARLVDSGDFETPDGPVPFVAMEYVAGMSLREWAAVDQPDPRRVVAILRHLAMALAYAHAQGVIHRDLKPENILVDADGLPKILDFGMARLVDPGYSGHSLMTRVGQVVGTIPYMSPEQAEAGPLPVDQRADLYALGIIGYELLAGRLPFDIPTDSLHRAIMAIVTAPRRPLGDVDAGLRGNLDVIITRLMERRPEDRYASAGELVVDLDRHLAGGRVAKPIRAPEPGTPRGRRIGLWLGILIVGFLLAAWSAPRFFPSLRGDAPIAADPDLIVLSTIQRLETISVLFDAGTRTGRSLRLALPKIDEAIDELERLPKSHLGRTAAWRQYLFHFKAESLYLLSGNTDDMDELFASLQNYQLADNENKYREAPVIPDSTNPVVDAVMRYPRHQPAYGQMNVHLALADFTRPSYHIRMAILCGEAAETCFTAVDPPTFRPGYEPSRLNHDWGWGCLQNDLGGAMTMLGSTRSDLALLERGLARIMIAESALRGQERRSEIGSIQQTLGRGYRLRSELTNQAADLDSARVALDRALELRTPSENSYGHAMTRLERARVGRVLAGRAGNPEDRRRHLDEALNELAVARQMHPTRYSKITRAEIELVWAETVTDISPTDPGALHAAEAGVDSVAVWIPPNRAPILGAESARIRAWIQECRWRAGLDGSGLASARRLIEEAIRSTPDAELPRHRQQLLLAADRLRTAK